MKNVFSIAIVALMFSTTQASATETQCQKNFGTDVSTCVQGISSSLSGFETAEAKKACIKDAKTAKVACENGTSACEAACQSTHDSEVAVCQSNYTRDVAACGDNVICQDIVAQTKLDCLASASNELNVCKSTCQ